MFRKVVLYCIFFCFCNTVFSQIGSVIGKKESHENLVSTKKHIQLSTKELAFSITRNAMSDSEKLMYIYDWITQNLSYDTELMRSEKLQKEIYTSEENIVRHVLDRKMALCGGFALLFKYLCADVGIKSEAVHGFTKDYSGKAQKRKKPNHTWNVVKLNGEWKLIDITWAIGHGVSGKPDNFWYFTRPEEFIFSHYPEDSKWTLLHNPISFSEFQNTLDR